MEEWKSGEERREERGGERRGEARRGEGTMEGACSSAIPSEYKMYPYLEVLCILGE